MYCPSLGSLLWPIAYCACSVIGSGELAAQEPTRHAASEARKVARVGRVAADQAPRIDGVLDEACWKDAPSLGELTMVEPWEGRTPPVRTDVRLLHDANNLYIGLWCFEPEFPVAARMRARDAWLDPDDRVEIMFDPMESRQIAYFFQVGAAGSLGDGLFGGNGSSFDKPWDAVWSAESRVTDEGWFAELAIPFRSLPYREGSDSWGFNIQRLSRARNETYRWANCTQRSLFFRPSEFGTLRGFGAVDAGRGMEVVPYLSLGASKSNGAAWDADVEGGGEFYWNLTPALKLALTAYTDFAETEVDDRQINLTRYPLYFREKRDFFLDGSAYFEFGSGSRWGEVSYKPFFSRRIGLSPTGEPLQILGGAKLTGRIGALDLGLLDVEVDGAGATNRENLGVIRGRYSLAEQTAVGLIATHGDPSSLGSNALMGVDFYHRWSEWLLGQDLILQADSATTTGDAENDDGTNAGLSLSSRGSELFASLSSRWVDEGFHPALGFVSRRGTQSTAASVMYEPRFAEGGALRNGAILVSADRHETMSGELIESNLAIDQLGFKWHTEDGLYLQASEKTERLAEDFHFFRDTVVVPAGDYRWHRGGVSCLTSEGRAWVLAASANWGGFYDGTSQDLEFDFQWRPSALLHLGAEYQGAHVDLGAGQQFTVENLAGRVALHFSPRLSLYNLLQYDNESRLLGWQSRLRWSYQPGCEFYAVLGTTWLHEQGAMTTEEQSLALKIQYSMRF